MPLMPEQPKPDLNDPVVAEAIRQHEERKAYNIAHGLDPTHPETYGKAPVATTPAQETAIETLNKIDELLHEANSDAPVQP